MAEHHTEAVRHDGRFGARFDDEISSRGVIGTIAGVAVMIALAMIAMLVFWRYSVAAGDTPMAVATPHLAAEAARLATPPTPHLQVDPEAELATMRRQMSKRLHGYGWTDQAAGVVHVPVAEAMALVLERGLNARVAPAAQPDGVTPDGSDTLVADPAEAPTAHGAHGS